LRIDLKPHTALAQAGDGLMVYLAVAARQTDGLNRGDVRRYDSVEGDSVTDETTGDGALRIPRRRPHLTLIVSKEAHAAPPRNFVSFPLARVGYNQTFELLKEFVPPTLAVDPASPPLGVMCAGTVKLLREKATYLADQLRNPTPGTRTGLEFEIKAHIRSLVAALPQFEAILAAKKSHPYALYIALCAVAGQVSAMGRELVLPDFAAYKHNDPRASFHEVITFIEGRIAEAIVSSFNAHRFNYEEGNGVYSLKFHPAWMGKRLSLGMRGQPGMTEQYIARWGNQCFIASGKRMGEIRQMRVPGVDRKQIVRDEDLVPPADTVLFHLEADSYYIIPDDYLQIYNPAEHSDSYRPAEIILYVRNPNQPTQRMDAR
jgi:type VI secretion system protein ImpJ